MYVKKNNTIHSYRTDVRTVLYGVGEFLCIFLFVQEDHNTSKTPTQCTRKNK